jgi:hypothetical protein
MSPGEQNTARSELALLTDWLEGRLDPVTAAQVAATVKQGSRELTDPTEWVRMLVRNADLDPLAVPPPLVRQRLRQSYRDWCDGSDDRTPVPAPAVLAFDSRVDRPARAVRGPADQNTIHLAYRAEFAELVLDIRTLGNGYARVDGQVFPHAETEAPVFEAIATSPAMVIRVVDGDELGRFRIAPIPSDRYELAVSNGEFAVTAALDLGAQ